MKALILAAGYAVRLYPLTKDFPKPLLKVGKKPIIEHIIAKLALVPEIDEIIVVTNSRFISRFRKWLSGLKPNIRISLVDDLTKSNEDKRGAIGDMDFAINKKRINDDLLVIGGDNIFDGDLSAFCAFAEANKPHPVIGAYDIKDIRQADKYGVIRINKKNRITDFKEKPKAPKSTLVAMCLYYFPKSKVKRIGQYLRSRAHKSDATGFYIDWLRRKDPVYSFVFGGHWYDIGDRKFYDKAKNNF
ncbi:MAG: nucleotidyltransferase family protein [Candidatus Omnitrophota bacterium]